MARSPSRDVQRRVRRFTVPACREPIGSRTTISPAMSSTGSCSARIPASPIRWYSSTVNRRRVRSTDIARNPPTDIQRAAQPPVNAGDPIHASQPLAPRSSSLLGRVTLSVCPTASSGMFPKSCTGCSLFAEFPTGTRVTAYAWAIQARRSEAHYGGSNGSEHTGDSTNFPTTAGAFQTSFGGNRDAFVTKLNPTGSALVYSTYLGGSKFDQGRAIAVDAQGSAF